MKSTGIIRGVDNLGRIVIPKSIRTMLDVSENRDSFEIFMDGNTICLIKYEPCCVFCDNARDIKEFKGKKVCPDCIKSLTK